MTSFFDDTVTKRVSLSLLPDVSVTVEMILYLPAGWIVPAVFLPFQATLYWPIPDGTVRVRIFVPAGL